MKKLIIVAALSSTVFAGAQPAGPDAEREGLFSEKFVKHLQEKLKLSEEQSGRIEKTVSDARPVLESKKAQLKALHEKEKAAMRDLQSAVWRVKETIRQALTDEQKQEFDEMTAAMNARPRGQGRPGMRRPGGGGGMPPSQMPGEGRPEGPPERMEPPQEEQPRPQTRERDYQD